jgi:hypothetical protein
VKGIDELRKNPPPDENQLQVPGVYYPYPAPRRRRPVPPPTP